jgi:hypothetical protein
MRHPLTRPDYGKSTQRIFGDVIRYLVSKPSTPLSAPTLDALGLGCSEGDSSLGSVWLVESPEDEAKEPFPSWVLRWDNNIQFHRCLSCSRLAQEWATSGDSVTELGNHSLNSSLVLKGLRLTTVSIIDRSLHCTAAQISDGEVSSLLRNLLRKNSTYLNRKTCHRRKSIYRRYFGWKCQRREDSSSICLR